MLAAALNVLRLYSRNEGDVDNIDRLHYWITSNTLIAIALLVSYKQFGGTPMECLVPKMFSAAWEQYAENYCWAQDTYYLPFDESMPKEISEREDRRISYYQWVPFFLLVEAFCFRLPSVAWKYLSGHSGIRIRDIIKIALDDRNIQQDVKLQNIKALTIHLQNALRFHRCARRRKVTPHRILRFLNLPYSAVYICTVYLIVKSLYLLNICGQLWLMNRFLETDRYHWYGFGALRDMLNGTTWEKSGVFPRVTLCDFQVRVMGNIQRYSVQCVLVINIFNEKIFIFLWFWFIILLAITTCSFVYWTYVILLPWPSRWFISRHLELSEMPFDPVASKKDVERFVCSYLKPDGAFVLRLVTLRSNIIFGTELLISLWCSFYGIEQQIQDDVVPAKEHYVRSPIEHLLRCRLKSLAERGSSEGKNGKTAAEKLLPILQEAKRQHEGDESAEATEDRSNNASAEVNLKADDFRTRKSSTVVRMEEYIDAKQA